MWRAEYNTSSLRWETSWAFKVVRVWEITIHENWTFEFVEMLPTLLWISIRLLLKQWKLWKADEKTRDVPKDLLSRIVIIVKEFMSSQWGFDFQFQMESNWCLQRSFHWLLCFLMVKLKPIQCILLPVSCWQFLTQMDNTIQKCICHGLV